MKYYIFDLKEHSIHGFDSKTELGKFLGLSTITIGNRFSGGGIFYHSWYVVMDGIKEHRSGRGNPNFGK